MKAVLIFLIGCIFLPAVHDSTKWIRPTAGTTISESEKHNFHVSYGQMAVEDSIAVCRVRYFGHDLEKALQEFVDDAELTLAVNPLVDSLYTSYYHKNLVLEYRGQALTGTISASGEDGEMWWYTMTYIAPDLIDSFRLKNTLLFDHFPDQKNIFKIKHFPSEISQSFYFTRGAEEYDITF